MPQQFLLPKATCFVPTLFSLHCSQIASSLYFFHQSQRFIQSSHPLVLPLLQVCVMAPPVMPFSFTISKRLKSSPAVPGATQTHIVHKAFSDHLGLEKKSFLFITPRTISSKHIRQLIMLDDVSTVVRIGYLNILWHLTFHVVVSISSN